MHPLDLSPRAHNFRSNYFSMKSSRNLPDNSYKDNSRKTSKIGNKRELDQGKRGRPRADILTTLMVEGSSSRSRIRCIKCGRAFPREKSLQAHVRTHTGEKPYGCDFPGCSKAFCQSGQLKTHQRLHTGEKPFACNIEGCESRFTHANRHCSTHPYAGLQRMDINLVQVAKLNESQRNADVKKWIEKYVRQSRERLDSKVSPKKASSVQESTSSSSSQMRPSTPVNIPVTNRIMSKAESPPMKLQSIYDEKIHPLDLTRSHHSPLLPPKLSPITALSLPPAALTFHGLPPPLTPILPQLSTQMPLTQIQSVQNSSPVTSSIESHISSKLGSSSLSSLSPSSLSSSSTTPSVPTFYRNHFVNLPVHEKKDDFYPYVLSSQMILQGHSNSSGTYFSQRFPLPVSYKQTSSSISERSTPCIINKDKEKDRYISALALIELSKG